MTKFISIIKNLIEKSMYYVEFNLLLIFSTLFMFFCIFNLVIVTYYDAPSLLLWDLYVIFFFKYVVGCTILLGIFILNLLTLKKHISYKRKFPLWYKIFYWVVLFINIVWNIFMSPQWYGAVYDTIHNIH